MFAGSAGHAILPLDARFTASFGIVLTGAAHGAGWPIVRGGSQRLADALASYFRSLGGEIQTNRQVRSLADLPEHRTVFFDVAPEHLLEICADSLNGRYRRRLLGYRRANSVFKLDYALSEPVPWAAAECRGAGTVHLGGTLEEMVETEDDVANNRLAERPLVLTAQPSLFDASRAPEGKHTLWAYCHLPRGSNADRTDAIERQIERFAPGFRDLVLGRSTLSPADAEAHNPNLVGGDITGGSNGGMQLFFRPGYTLWPYDTPAEGVYLCSASTPPGGGVHGMSGYWAARRALGRELR
jgi:phytoene dehydrogenase-like protein